MNEEKKIWPYSRCPVALLVAIPTSTVSRRTPPLLMYVLRLRDFDPEIDWDCNDGNDAGGVREAARGCGFQAILFSEDPTDEDDLMCGRASGSFFTSTSPRENLSR